MLLNVPDALEIKLKITKLSFLLHFLLGIDPSLNNPLTHFSSMPLDQVLPLLCFLRFVVKNLLHLNCSLF